MIVEDLFLSKGIHPMLIGEERDPFDSSDYIYELKLDGIRCIAYLDKNGTDLRNKRNKQLLPCVPELAEIHKQVSCRCILDGELFVLKNGVTDFYEIQRRVMMTSPFKIRLAAKQYPACFVAYDVLQNEFMDITKIPLMDRKAILKNIVTENNYIGVSRYIEYNGKQFFELAKQRGLEGIVAKKKDSLYWFNKRSKDWIKSKVYTSGDYIICGYIQKSDTITSLVLGQYDGEILKYRGHVTLGVSLPKLNEHPYLIVDDSPFGYVPEGNGGATWIDPRLVCIVESMPTDNGNFRQPVFKGIRDDKLPTECQINS